MKIRLLHPQTFRGDSRSRSGSLKIYGRIGVFSLFTGISQKISTTIFTVTTVTNIISKSIKHNTNKGYNPVTQPTKHPARVTFALHLCNTCVTGVLQACVTVYSYINQLFKKLCNTGRPIFPYSENSFKNNNYYGNTHFQDGNQLQ